MDISGEPLYTRMKGVQTRWASPENFSAAKGAGGKACGGRKGSANFPLKSGESRTLAEVTGSSGTIRRMWFTFENRSAEVLRGLRLQMFWDGAARPAVDVPFGDFFGQGLGRTAVFQSELFSNPEGRSFHALVPMPFRSACRVLLVNESSADLASVFYDINMTLGDRHGEDMLYFHSCWRRENPTRLREDFELLPRVEGAGRYLGTTLSVRACADGWWGEGEVKVYLDGDREFPSLCGTGTEDYIGTAWGQGAYGHLYQGCPIADEKNRQYCFYRHHVKDPVLFEKEIRVTIQQLGVCGPTGARLNLERGTMLYRGLEPLDLKRLVEKQDCSVFERQDDWSCCTYFYLDRAENSLPALAPVKERVRGLIGSEDAGKRLDLEQP